MTIFKDSHHFSRTLGSLWWQSLRTAITSAELWAVFDDNLSRQPSLQQNFRQCLITMFNDSAFFERTLRGRFREKETFQTWTCSVCCHKILSFPGFTMDVMFFFIHSTFSEWTKHTSSMKLEPSWLVKFSGMLDTFSVWLLGPRFLCSLTGAPSETRGLFFWKQWLISL